MELSTDDLQSITQQDTWYSFTADKDSIKIIKLNLPVKDNIIVDEIKVDLGPPDVEFPTRSLHSPPLLDSERYVGDSSDEEIEMEVDRGPEHECEVATLCVSSKENSSIPESTHDVGKGGLFSLLIHQILSSQVLENSSMIYKDIHYKQARIFGTIIEINISVNNNIITIDDGTGQLACILKADLNVDDYDSMEDIKVRSDDPHYKFYQNFYGKNRQMQEELPTFEEMKIGDRVCALGNISFYKDNFYMFVEQLQRPENVSLYFGFLERIFEQYY